MTADREPDAFVVIHQPKGGGDPYGVGPFPCMDGLPEAVTAHPTCDCDLTVLWIGFPRGITMAIGIDMDVIKGMVEGILATDTDLLN